MTGAEILLVFGTLGLIVGVVLAVAALETGEFAEAIVCMVISGCMMWVGGTGFAMEQQQAALGARTPLSQTEMIIAIEEVLRDQGSPAVCEPASPSEINCTLTVDPNDDL